MSLAMPVTGAEEDISRVPSTSLQTIHIIWPTGLAIRQATAGDRVGMGCHCAVTLSGWTPQVWDSELLHCKMYLYIHGYFVASFFPIF